MSEKFCLKWNDFSSNASKSFGLFRNEEYLHDVTLVSDDQHQVTAHKLVLSASSDYFKNIFKNTKLSNPFICLEGVSSTDLNNVLDYIYNGEIQIYQDHLERFLDIAQRFKIEGLLGGEQKQEKVENEINPIFDPTQSKTIKHEKAKQESSKSFYVEEKSLQLNNQIHPINNMDLTELDQKLYENMEKNSDGTYSCKFCGKMIPNRYNMKFHVESHMEGLSYPCHTCGKEFRSRDSLKSHNYRQHK